jgi:hypothetical protein
MPFDISDLPSRLDFLTSEKFWTGVAVAVVVALLTKAGQMAWRLAVDAWNTRHQFGLSGFWAGACMLPTFEKPTLELWYYSLAGDRVNLTFYSYSSAELKPVKWVGGGVFRGDKLSAYYYVKDVNSSESGTITVELKGLRLRGVYAQFDPNDRRNQLFVSKKDYEQLRVRLTRRQRAWIFFGFPPVATHQDVENLLAAARGNEKEAAALGKVPEQRA